MKHFLSATIALLLVVSASAQVKQQNLQAKYEVVASFTSICCGTTSDDFLKTFVKNYNKKNKVSVNAFHVGGCGREGEYNILFSLSKLSKAKKAKFITALKNLIVAQNKKITAANQNKGPVNLSYDQTLSQFSSCRIAMVKWI